MTEIPIEERTDPPTDPEGAEDEIAEADTAGSFAMDIKEPPRSLIERLRQKRQDAADRIELDLDLPGYDGELVARYRLMQAEELEVIGRKVRRQFKSTADRLAYGSADVLIAACVGFFFRDSGNHLVPIGDAMGLPLDDMVRFDDRLAEFLNFPAESARDVALGVFGGNEMALVQQEVKLARWMSDTSQDVNQDFLGEF